MEQEQVPPTNDMSVEEQIQYIDRHVFSTSASSAITGDTRYITIRTGGGLLESMENATPSTYQALTIDRLSTMLADIYQNDGEARAFQYNNTTCIDSTPKRSRRDKKKEKEFNFLLSIKTIKNEGKEGA